MIKKIVLNVVILLILGGAKGSSGVKILVPGEHVSTFRTSLSIVGTTQSPKVRIYLNGEFQHEQTVFDSVFHTNIRLPYGLNEIKVFSVNSESDQAGPDWATIEVLCGPEFSRDQDRFFQPYSFHGDKQSEFCQKCHFQISQDKTDATQAEWCYPCHSKVRQRLRAHNIEDLPTCTGCHKIGRDLTSSISNISDGQNPCYNCHQDKIGLFARDFVHGPVAGGSCTVCHDPHGSEFSNTLISPVPVLCETCHSEIYDQNKPVQHYPFAQGWCVDCHDPHATSNKWVLLREGQELCLMCHFNDGTQKTHRHPFGVKPKHELSVSLTLGEDGQLECLSCHEPHVAGSENLLRSTKSNVCLGCHPELE